MVVNSEYDFFQNYNNGAPGMTGRKNDKSTTITIDKETMRELKQRALDADMRYSDYLEELIRNAWRNTNSKRGGGSSRK